MFLLLYPTTSLLTAAKTYKSNQVSPLFKIIQWLPLELEVKSKHLTIAHNTPKSLSSACLLDFISDQSLPHPLHLSHSVVVYYSNTPTKKAVALTINSNWVSFPQFLHSWFLLIETSTQKSPLGRALPDCLVILDDILFNSLYSTYHCLKLAHSVKLLYCLSHYQNLSSMIAEFLNILYIRKSLCLELSRCYRLK